MEYACNIECQVYPLQTTESVGERTSTPSHTRIISVGGLTARPFLFTFGHFRTFYD
jgi:hypothetical protein